jgi:acyl carrier protein
MITGILMNAEELLRKHLKKRGFGESITAATRMDELDIDSLTVMEIVMEVEDELGVEVAEADVEKLVTVGDFIEMVKRYAESKSGTPHGDEAKGA